MDELVDAVTRAVQADGRGRVIEANATAGHIVIALDEDEHLQIGLHNALYEVNTTDLTLTDVIELYILSSIDERDEKFVLQPDKLRLVVRNAVYLAPFECIDAVQADLARLSKEVFVRPWCGEMVVAVVQEEPRSHKFVAQADADRAGLSVDDIWSIAAENLSKVIGSIEIIENDDGVNLIMVNVAGADGPEAPLSMFTLSVVLMPAFLTDMHKRFPAGFAVSMPDRVTLVAAGTAEPSHLDRLRRYTRVWYDDTHHQQSTQIFVWSEGSWKVLLESGAQSH